MRCVFAALLTLLLALAAPAARAVGRLEVHFIDVGQGDAILVRAPGGKTVLIDAGNIEAGEVVDAYLTRLGVGALDLVIASHPHLDHLGGMLEVLMHHRPAAYLDPGYAHPLENYDRMLDWLEAEQVPVKNGRAGRTITLEPGVTLELLAPEEPLLAGTRSDANSNSVVGRLAYGQVSFLFTGDSEAETEKRLMNGGGLLASTVLKVAHHGGRYSTSDPFLGRVAPKFAVISCGAINGYGHPSAPTLERLAAREIQTFRTDRDGDVVARTDGTTLTWEKTGERSAKLDEPGGRRSLDRHDLRSGADPNKVEAKSTARAVRPAESGGVAPVDLNTAGPEEIASLPGIGPALAGAIVADRTKNGAYADVDAVLRVRGIGHGLVERIRPRAVASLPDGPAPAPTKLAEPPAPKAAPFTAAPRPSVRSGLAFRGTARTALLAAGAGGEPVGARLLAVARRTRVNLNLAGASAIAASAGIALDQASLLLGHRATFGPFHAMAELSQVPGLGPRERAALFVCCTVRIDLNHATEADLVSLGLEGGEAHAILERRRVVGRFVTVDDLEELDALVPERREKVLPLLTVEQVGS